MSSKKFEFLVEVTTIDEDVVEDRGWYSAQGKFSKRMIQRIMQAIAETPDLVCIDVDVFDEETYADEIIKNYEAKKMNGNIATTTVFYPPVINPYTPVITPFTQSTPFTEVYPMTSQVNCNG